MASSGSTACRACLKITRFVPLDLSAATAKAAMVFHFSQTDAVIVDLRSNIVWLRLSSCSRSMSYFTGPQPIQLVAHYTRDGELDEPA